MDTETIRFAIRDERGGYYSHPQFEVEPYNRQSEAAEPDAPHPGAELYDGETPLGVELEAGD